MLATLMDRPQAANSGNTLGYTRMLFLFERWRYNVAILASSQYDGDDANDGIAPRAGKRYKRHNGICCIDLYDNNSFEVYGSEVLTDYTSNHISPK